MLGEFSPGNVSYIHHQVEFIEYWNFKSTKNFIWKSFQQFYLFLLFGSSRPSDAPFIMTRSWHSPIAEIISSIKCQIFLNSSEYQIQVPCWYLGTWSVVWSIYFTYHSQSYLHVRHNFINLFIVLNIYKCFNNLNSFCTPCILRCFLVKFSSTRWFSLYSYTSTTIINY